MPWRKLVRRDDRLRISRLTLDLVRAMHSSLYDGRAHLGTKVDTLFVACCVGIGHAENRPMTAAKISHFLDMPRTTVLRKLDELMDIGAVERSGNNYYIAPARQDVVDHIGRANVAIVSTAKEIMAAEQAIKERPQPANTRAMSEMDSK